MCKAAFRVPIRKLLSEKWEWTGLLNIRRYDWLLMAYGCLVHCSADMLSIQVLVLKEFWNGHFREWWDGNVFSWDLLTSTVFRWFFKTLAITIRCFLTCSPLDSMVFRWFSGPWPSPSNVFWHFSRPGWQKLHGSTGGTRRKVWTRTKILNPNIRYFVAN